MQHPAPQSTTVTVQCQNNQTITADVIEYVGNETTGYHYKLQSNGWGDGNISESVILKGVSQNIVILEPDKP